MRYLKGQKVKVLVGDFKNQQYEVLKYLKNHYVVLKDLYGLNSKKKSYLWKIHQSNLKKL